MSKFSMAMEEVGDMVDNLAAIKGEKYAEIVSQLINGVGLLTGLAIEKSEMTGNASLFVRFSTLSLAQAYGLTDSEYEEAVKDAKRLSHQIVTHCR